jgi:hypothetical protein
LVSKNKSIVFDIKLIYFFQISKNMQSHLLGLIAIVGLVIIASMVMLKNKEQLTETPLMQRKFADDTVKNVSNYTAAFDSANLNSKAAGDKPEDHARAEHLAYYTNNVDVSRSEHFDSNTAGGSSVASQQTNDYVTFARSMAVDSDTLDNHAEWVKNRLRSDQNWTGRTFAMSDWETTDDTNWIGIRGPPAAVPIDRSRQKQVLDVDETKFPTKRRFTINNS